MRVLSLACINCSWLGEAALAQCASVECSDSMETGTMLRLSRVEDVYSVDTARCCCCILPFSSPVCLPSSALFSFLPRAATAETETD